MRIGEVAQLAGVSTRSIRHYEQAGLIHSTRLANGYRDLDAGTFVRVRNIKALLDVGLTLDDVRAFECCLDGDVTTARPDPTKVAIAHERLTLLQQRRDQLITACQTLEDTLAGL